MPWPRRKRFRLNMMVLLHIGGTDPAIGPAPAPVVQRQDDGLQNRQWRFDSSPACVFPVRGRAPPSAAPSHRTAGRTGPVRPRIGSLPFAFVAQRIGRPPPEREATGSNPVEGTRVRAVTRLIPRGRVTRTHGPAPHSSRCCQRSAFRPPMPAERVRIPSGAQGSTSSAVNGVEWHPGPSRGSRDAVMESGGTDIMARSHGRRRRVTPSPAREGRRPIG